MFPISHKPTETTPFFQDHSFLDDPRVTDDRKSREGHHEVTIHFSSIARDRMEKRLANGAKRLGWPRRFKMYAY